jgi:2-keto-4-pentenoate hydratase
MPDAFSLRQTAFLWSRDLAYRWGRRASQRSSATGAEVSRPPQARTTRNRQPGGARSLPPLRGRFGCDESGAMSKPDRIETAAGELVRQRLSLAPIDPAEDMRPAGELEAYAFQAEVNRQLSRSGLGSPVGHKIGCTTPVMQAYLGISNPCAGEIFSATIVESQGRIRRADYRRPGVECEIAIGLSRDLAADQAPFTRDSVASHVDAVMAGIEIVDDRYRDFRSLGAPTLIADNFFNAGCVLGEPVREWRQLDLARLEGRMLINGREVGRGDGGMILGHPLEALAWLANSRAARGLSLRKGAFVFLGSLVETRWPDAGDLVRIEIDRLGALDLQVAA